MLIRLPCLSLAPLLWFSVVVTAMAFRPLLPVDETRYLSVAWEMWRTEDYLVPKLNGEVYSHKPPLFFWLMHLGWWFFGVSDWWPRLVAPLFGLACLFLTSELGRLLWPSQKRTRDLAPLILFGFGFWTIFTTLTMFDTIFSFFILVGHFGVLVAWRSRRFSGFLILGIGIGLGGLTKGPAVLIHILPVALLAPIWAPKLSELGTKVRFNFRQWYFGILIAILTGIIIVLLWAIPAGISGGEEYKNAIFFGQTVGRITKSFAHQRSWWWYFSLLPALLLPWILWPPIWRAFATFRDSINWDGGVRFCFIWFLASLVFFSMISGKQLHYLLPEFPALSLLAGIALTRIEPLDKSRFSRWFPAILAMSFGGLIAIFPVYSFLFQKVVWLNKISFGWGIILIVMGLWILKGLETNIYSGLRQITLVVTGLVFVFHLALFPVVFSNYYLLPLAQKLKLWQDKGFELANFGKYHGQYNFLGRLKKPITVIGVLASQKKVFLQKYPDGRIIAYYKIVPTTATPVLTYPFRQKTVAIWEADDLIKDSRLGDRRKNE